MTTRGIFTVGDDGHSQVPQGSKIAKSRLGYRKGIAPDTTASAARIVR